VDLVTLSCSAPPLVVCGGCDSPPLAGDEWARGEDLFLDNDDGLPRAARGEADDDGNDDDVGL
jgi:hypothetical protein